MSRKYIKKASSKSRKFNQNFTAQVLMESESDQICKEHPLKTCEIGVCTENKISDFVSKRILPEPYYSEPIDTSPKCLITNETENAMIKSQLTMIHQNIELHRKNTNLIHLNSKLATENINLKKILSENDLDLTYQKEENKKLLDTIKKLSTLITKSKKN
jgi:hypothetical protein